jgi:hypothetical protein
MNDGVSSMRSKSKFRAPLASLSHAERSRSSSVKIHPKAGTERPERIPETMHTQLT